MARVLSLRMLRCQVPLLGLVENMSTYICPACGNVDPIFGTEGGARTAAELGLDLLAQVNICPIAAQRPGAPVLSVCAAQSNAAALFCFMHPENLEAPFRCVDCGAGAAQYAGAAAL